MVVEEEDEGLSEEPEQLNLRHALTVMVVAKREPDALVGSAKHYVLK